MESKDATIELGPMGPIGEQEALILRVNRHCPWNRCLFCSAYKNRRFSLRSLDEIKGDIDRVARLRDELESISLEMGTSGRISGETVREMLRRYPDVYGTYPVDMTSAQARAADTLGAVVNCILYGAKRVFLQDADALVTKTPELAETIRHLKKTFPSVTTVSSYGRSKTCRHTHPEELAELHEAGLTWCYVGLESGCDDVLSFMKKRGHAQGAHRRREGGDGIGNFHGCLCHARPCRGR